MGEKSEVGSATVKYEKVEVYLHYSLGFSGGRVAKSDGNAEMCEQKAELLSWP